MFLLLTLNMQLWSSLLFGEIKYFAKNPDINDAYLPPGCYFLFCKYYWLYNAFSKNWNSLIFQPPFFRSSRPEMFCIKGVLKIFTKFTGKRLCQSLFIKKETLAQVFSCEFCEIFWSTFFNRTPLVVGSVSSQWSLFLNPWKYHLRELKGNIDEKKRV